MRMSALARYFYGCDDGKKGGNEVVDDEDDDVGSSGFDLHTPYFALFVFHVCLLSEGAWVLRNVLTLLLRS